MKQNSTKINVNSTKSGSTTARNLIHKMAIRPDWLTWRTSCPHTQKFTNLRPHSSPCRVYSRNDFQNMLRPATTTVADPALSFLDIRRILLQKITEKGDELQKAFELLDSSHNKTVSKSELRRVVTTFLLPLTREQFRDVLAQVPLTSTGAVPYLEFLSRFGRIRPDINVIRRDNGNEMKPCRTLKELEIQVGEKILKNIKTVISALQLIDVNQTGLVQARELRRVLETFCVKIQDDEYKNSFVLTGVSLENQHVKNSNRSYLPSSNSSENSWEDYSLEEVERTFCLELSKCHEKVEKALSAGDPSKHGYVSLNYLKVVLDTFVYRLPRRIFIQLMRRFGLKTTSKVRWKQLLASLPDPQWVGVHDTVPLTGTESTNSKNHSRQENIISKLFGQEDRRASLKRALLTVNTKWDGQIKREELQHIINCMVVKISDSEFKELMQTLDPGRTGLVSANTFLELLEQSPKTEKLPSSADAKKPVLPARDSVEAMARDAISRNLVAFYNMLQSYDLGDTGLMRPNNFKKVMHIFCPCLMRGQLAKLCSKFQDNASGRILYKNLLASMGINGPPTISPALAPKDRPFRDHFQEAERQQPGHSERTKPTEGKSTVTKNVTKDEVTEKLNNCAQPQDPASKNQFLGFSKEPEGKVHVRDFRKVQAGDGMPVDDGQYPQLTAKSGYKKGGVSCLESATGSAGAKANGLLGTPPQTTFVSKSHLASFFVTAEECLELLPQRLKASFRDPYAAFFRTDADRDGIISMRDLHRLLEQLLLNLRDEEFERFLSLLGLRLSVTLNFREFRNLFEKSPFTTEDAPQRVIRPTQKVADSELACEQAHQYLVTKAKTRWSDLSKNFTDTDQEGNGILRRQDIKNVLYGFAIPLTPREFETFWMRYDTEGRGHITYREFLEKLGLTYSADVHRPYAEDHSNFMGHFSKPQPVHEETTVPPLSRARAGPARDKLKDRYQDIKEALTTLDKPQRGSVSMCQLQAVLRGCGCPLEEEELAELLGSWGISWQNNSINYLDFLRAMEDSGLSGPEPREKAKAGQIDFAKLRPEEVLKNVQDVVTHSGRALAAAFSALDKEDTAFVKASEFGQVLKDFCYKLTDNQYHYFLRKLKIHLTPYIHWKYFLRNFSHFLEETASEWAERMPRGPPPKSPKEMAHPEILARLHKAVTSQYHTIAQEFENFDTAKTNTVSREEFRAVCTRHVQVLTDEQFNGLWKEMPVNAKGRLKYLDFLSRFESEKVATSRGTGDSAKAHRGSDVPKVSAGSRSVGSSPTRDLKAGMEPRSHPCTPARAGPGPGALPLQNCEPAESRLRKKIQGCWREFLKECKELDTSKRGDIATSEFLALAEKFKLDISKEERRQLAMKYDLRGNGRFAYCDFLQSCVLLLRAKETAPTQRMKIQNAHKMKEAGAETSSFYSALLRIQPQIVHCWRPMRRTFKACDEGGTGLIGVADFRKVLRQYCINLSEEEFFHILEYYDKTLSSKISYNDFFRAFLQ